MHINNLLMLLCLDTKNSNTMRFFNYIAGDDVKTYNMKKLFNLFCVTRQQHQCVEILNTKNCTYYTCILGRHLLRIHKIT